MSSACAAANSCRLSPPKSIFSTTSSGFFGTATETSPFAATGFRGGPPTIDSRTCNGSGTFGGGGPPAPGRARPEPLGIRAVEGRLAVDEAGVPAIESDDVLVGSPGRGGKGPGPAPRYGRLGAGECESRRGGGVPDGVEWAERRSSPHMMLRCLCCSVGLPLHVPSGVVECDRGHACIVVNGTREATSAIRLAEPRR